MQGAAGADRDHHGDDQGRGGNPFNDAHYIGFKYDVGHRIARITERLQTLVSKGGVTPEDMMALQGDPRSPLGSLLAQKFVEVAKRVQEERASPGTLVKLVSLVPPTSGESAATIPAPGDATFPNGFPRPGDNFVVDASQFGLSDPEKFSYENGPVQRLVVEMMPEGPRAWNALPGGQVFDPRSPHHADEMEHWRRNKAPALSFTDAEVNAHRASSVSYAPADD